MPQHKSNQNNSTPVGDSYICEPTGSAECINVDGKSEYGQYNLTKQEQSGGTGENPLAE
ncbi:LAS seventeen-binding protein 3 [Desulforamulus ferrireducens]|uniref:LAS seventeen-binding protein 3 n=1 Tax=Desulforamulus ferrireducens TaxID=1833852 RepID=UPI0011EA5A90|nr:LAS seventeen-binding protein 3 [Desulforamulus ferrireducens]